VTIMEDKILSELKQIRKLLADVVGTTDLPTSQKFSKEAIAKAAKEFKNLSIERGQWIPGHDIHKVIRHADYNSSKIILDKFEFKNYFIRGKTYYFNRKDLVELNKELKKRNINLEKYGELINDKEKFQKYVRNILLPKGTKTRKHFKVPEGLKDIFSKPYSAPTEELVRNEISTLMEEFKKFDLSEYIDLYEGKTHALFKYNYSFDRYLKPELKKFCKDWSFKFNYANTALKRILELKEESPALI
jgi:Ca2+-binding EF-hand superfamily protein